MGYKIANLEYVEIKHIAGYLGFNLNIVYEKTTRLMYNENQTHIKCVKL